MRQTDHYIGKQVELQIERERRSVSRTHREAERHKNRQTRKITSQTVTYPETKAIISFLSVRRPQDDVSVNECVPNT